MGLERPVMVNPYDYLPPVPSFTVTSADLVDGQQVDLVFVHDSAGGENRSPQLAWSGFPEGTQSFVVTCFDPDAPIPSGFWHWTVVDVPLAVTSFSQGAAGRPTRRCPGGPTCAATSRSASYGGCAPPQGDHPHRYFFVVHAVDIPASVSTRRCHRRWWASTWPSTPSPARSSPRRTSTDGHEGTR